MGQKSLVVTLLGDRSPFCVHVCGQTHRCTPLGWDQESRSLWWQQQETTACVRGLSGGCPILQQLHVFFMQRNRVPTDRIKQQPTGPAQIICIYCISDTALTRPPTRGLPLFRSFSQHTYDEN